MNPPESTRHPRNFIRPDNPTPVIRLRLIRKRLEKNRHRIKKAATLRGVSGLALSLVSLVSAAALMVAGFYVVAILKDLPTVENLEVLAGSGGMLYQPTRYYDRTGQFLIPGGSVNSQSLEYHTYTTNSDSGNLALFTNYVELLMATSYPGSDTDLPDTSRVATTNKIAERLVSTLLLPGEPPSFVLSIRLRLLTAQASARFEQAKLLEWYLNSTNYSRGMRGAGAASSHYFNKTVDQLNPGEMLILAVISLEPAINPIDSPEAFDTALRDSGSRLLNQGLVDNAILQQAVSALADISAIPEEQETTLPAFYAAAREQFSTDTGSDHPEQGGLSVITTLNIDLQTRLECALFEMLDTPQGQLDCIKALSGLTTVLPRVAATDELRVNFVLLDPTSGQVQAMFGDYTPGIGELSYLQPHPSGSLVTPFIYLTGLLQGISPATMVWDTPTGLSETVLDYYSTMDEFQGPMSVRTALSGDHLAPADKLLTDYGQDSVTALMSSFGLPLYAGEGIPYTSGIADSLSVAQAYGVFANKGVKAGSISQQQSGILIPTTILRAVDSNDQLILEQKARQEQILISPALAFLVNDMLASDITGLVGYQGSTKAGTTADGADYWRVAYTPDYVFVVWLGYSDPAGNPQLSSLGIDKALIRILEETVSSNTTFDGWQIPAGVSRLEVCEPSGMLPDNDCPQKMKEYFLVGTEPTETDSLYVKYPIDTETGRLATVFTDPAHITRQVFFNPPAEELSWARAAGYPLIPSEYDVYQSGSATGSTVIVEPLNFSRVKGKITISGNLETAGFISYRLDLGTGLAPSQWLQVGAAKTSLPNGKVLGVLDTTRYANGLYTLRIQVLRSGNMADNSYLVILINNSTTD